MGNKCRFILMLIMKEHSPRTLLGSYSQACTTYDMQIKIIEQFSFSKHNNPGTNCCHDVLREKIEEKSSKLDTSWLYIYSINDSTNAKAAQKAWC